METLVSYGRVQCVSQAGLAPRGSSRPGDGRSMQPPLNVEFVLLNLGKPSLSLPVAAGKQACWVRPEAPQLRGQQKLSCEASPHHPLVGPGEEAGRGAPGPSGMRTRRRRRTRHGCQQALSMTIGDGPWDSLHGSFRPPIVFFYPRHAVFFRRCFGGPPIRYGSWFLTMCQTIVASRRITATRAIFDPRRLLIRAYHVFIDES
jgi:hypothetical protein